MGYKHFGYFYPMKWLSRLFDFYLDASIHVALSVLSLAVATVVLFDISVEFPLLLFLFFGSISCYNFIKYGIEAEKYLKITNLYYKNILYFSIVCLLLAVYHAFYIEKGTWGAIAVLAIMTGLYAVPILPKSKNLRSWGGLKIFIVAVVWAGATVVLPVLEDKGTLSSDVLIETIQRMFVVLVLLIPFEIRDLKYDALELSTLPQRFGVSKTKAIGLSMTIGFFLLTFLKDDIMANELLEKSLLAVMLIWGVLATKQDQSKYFASFWVEAIPIVWVALLFLLKKVY